MANNTTPGAIVAPTTGSDGGVPPVAFVVAAWLGMPREEILRGLHEGWIAAPPGSPPGWTPAVWSGAGAAGDSAPGGATASGSVTATDPPEAGPSEPAVDRARVHGWLRALDPALTEASFASLWRGAGTDDVARGNAWTARLAGMLLRGDGNAPFGLGAGLPPEAIDRAVLEPANRATLLDLGSMSGQRIAARAGDDVGVRHALATLDGVAFAGNRRLAGLADPDGALDRYDADTGDIQRSDAWIDDRAKFVAWRQHIASGGASTIPGDAGWSFVDHAHRDADGRPTRLDLVPADGASHTHQVLFGSGGADTLAGGAASDRIHGDAGDDWLRGAGGNDLLEGGRGDDTLSGGRGDDDLAGGRGDDDLDGGAGADRLDGGTGDDTLAGGRGDDLLAGGPGVDTYVFDAGDGIDAIVDADGLGCIVVDDRELSGIAVAAGGRWRSADGAVSFQFSGDARHGGELAITVGAASPAGGDGHTIRVRGFRNGDLGLTFGDGSAAALAAGSASVSIGDTAIGAIGAIDVTVGGTIGAAGDAAANDVANDSASGPDEVFGGGVAEAIGDHDPGNEAPAFTGMQGTMPVAGSEAPLLPPWPDVVAAMGTIPDLATILGADPDRGTIASPPDVDVIAGSMQALGGDPIAGSMATEAWYDGGPAGVEIAAAEAAGATQGDGEDTASLSTPQGAPPWASWWAQGAVPVPPPPERTSSPGHH
jgi:Ca2+-binding RTX toxin-like protein